MDEFAPQLERDLRAQYSHLMYQWYELVDWTEPLIVSAIASHITLAIIIFVTRKHLPTQFVLFILLILLIYAAEPLNNYCRDHWQDIATQQYFDRNGVFIGIFYAAPLLSIGFFQLILSMKQAVNLIIIAKRAEIHKSKEE